MAQKKEKYCIYLFRHSQTFYNKKKIFTGWKDSKLTPFGKKQAQMVSKKLKDVDFRVAYHSGLTRSKDTLKAVLRYHPECKTIIKDRRIIERSYGDFAGHTHKWAYEKFGEKEFEKYHRGYDYPPPKGESLKMVKARVDDFLKDLFKKIKDEKINVAISAHGNSMRPMRKYFEKLSQKEMISLENPWDDYFSYEIIFEKGKPKIKRTH
ncbi:MAG: histidine phosphatase family protein [Candidatus Woesearchaeota archaeon]